VVESLVIVLIIFLLAYAMVRRGKKQTAIVIIPLSLVPIGNILSFIFMPFFFDLTSKTSVIPYMIFLIVFLLLSVILFFACSLKFKKPNAKKTYIGVCIAFSTLLCVNFIWQFTII
ncbi:MAG: hypothetical protein RSB96_03370, partial [Oscillospiraceae bacterium]